MADAPEIATKPTRRLVAHGGYDATLRLRVPDALEQLENDAGVAPFLMWVVFGLNSTTMPFQIVGADLYPLPIATDHLAVRSFYGAPCLNNSDPFNGGASSGGCLALSKDARGGELFDMASNPGPCPATGLCKNTITYHSIYTVPALPTHPVLLGDLGAYVSMSGYRFRLAKAAVRATLKKAFGGAGGEAVGGAVGGAVDGVDGVGGSARDVIVVGEPGEIVPVTYLVPHGGSVSGWLVREVPITVGSDGRKQFAMV
jgi:hypothetical protein